LHTLLDFFSHTKSANLAVVIALALSLALLVVGPRSERALVRFPARLALVAGCFVLVAALLPARLAVVRLLAFLALLAALVSAARSVFLLLLDAGLARRLGGDVPRIVRDLAQGFLYVVALLVFLRALGLEPGSILATSALLTAVIGLALQDTLSNLFSGLSLQFQRVFEPGDWVQWGDDERHVGRVTEVNWRATKLLTLDSVEVVIPNGVLARATVRNLTHPTRVSRRSIDVLVSYDARPSSVRATILEALHGTDGLLAAPAPTVVTRGLADSGVLYTVFFHIDDFASCQAIDGEVRERVYYALRRAGLEIPFPIRTVRLERRSRTPAREAVRAHELEAVPFFAALGDCERVAEGAERRHYATHELIVRQGTRGDDVFVLARGEASVVLDRGDHQSLVEVARLGPGQLFGEMALLTGEDRSASVLAATECEVLVIPKRVVGPLLEARPAALEQLGAALSQRKAQIHEVLEERPASSAPKPERDALLARIRAFFGSK
jgi:small-conductance mechanosensitive channel